MKRNFLFFILTLLFAFPAFGQSVKIGDLVFQENFNSAESRAKWSVNQRVRFVEKNPGDPSDQCVYVEISPDQKKNSASIGIKLDPKGLSGTELRLSARIKSENVEKPEVSHNGIDVQLHIKSAEEDIWCQSGNQYGTSAWRIITCKVLVPNDPQIMDLSIGLEKTCGKLWVDDVEIKVDKKRRERPAVKALYDKNGKRKAVYTGHRVPRLRGVMISPGRLQEEDLRVLGEEWKANHIRWQLNCGFPHGRSDTATIEEFSAWIDSECKKLDQFLPICRKYGLSVCLDLHNSPGGRDKASNGRMFQNKEYQDAFIATWIKLVKKYKDEPAIWGYDLLNEPTETEIPEGKGILNWRDLAEKTGKIIRKIDPVKPIIIEPAPWGNPAPLDFFEPVDVSNVVYSVHMYLPHQFTHQGVHNKSSEIEYPGKLNNIYWDKDQLRKALRPAIEFYEDYGVQLYIGEFSAIRWAPNDSAYRYLRDVIDIFEEYGWDWAYHAYREWSGWSVEHIGDRDQEERAKSPTNRELLLRSWFKKNEKAVPVQ